MKLRAATALSETIFAATSSTRALSSQGSGARVAAIAGRRSERETAGTEPLAGDAPAEIARLGEEARREEDAVQQDGHEQPLDVLRVHVGAPVEQRPRTDGAVEGERAPDRAAGRDLVEL